MGLWGRGRTTAMRRGYRDTVVAAACLGLVWLGDALIYVVLPLYPAAFGVEVASVAILLSVNRVIRIVGYGWVSPLARRFGANTLTAAACAAGALSTLAYGLLSGFVAAVHRAADVGRRLWRDQSHQHGLCLRRRPVAPARVSGSTARSARSGRCSRSALGGFLVTHGRAAARVRHLRPGRLAGGAARADAAAAAPDRRAMRRPPRAGAGRRARST